MKIVSYNIACGWNYSGTNSFSHRAGMIWKKIREEAPDIIAFQEIVPIVREYLTDILPEYVLVGHLRGTDYDEEGLYTAIRRDSFELIGYETFWLSPTPYVPGSRFAEQSDCPRICVVTTVRNKKTGELLRIYNLHLDFASDEASYLNMKCALDRMTALDAADPHPSILLGDFNAAKGSKTIDLCENYRGGILTDLAAGLEWTFHGFEGNELMKIDYIYVTKELADRASAARIWDDCEDGIYLSDHYPVAAEIDDAR